MANEAFLLEKINRNILNMGVASVNNGISVVAGGLTITLVNPDIASPMGGIDPANSPFLGVIAATAHTIKIKGASGENTIAGIIDSAANLAVASVCVRFCNNVIVEAGDATTQLAVLRGHPDLNVVDQ